MERNFERSICAVVLFYSTFCSAWPLYRHHFNFIFYIEFRNSIVKITFYSLLSVTEYILLTYVRCEFFVALSETSIYSVRNSNVILILGGGDGDKCWYKKFLSNFIFLSNHYLKACKIMTQEYSQRDFLLTMSKSPLPKTTYVNWWTNHDAKFLNVKLDEKLRFRFMIILLSVIFDTFQQNAAL